MCLHVNKCAYHHTSYINCSMWYVQSHCSLSTQPQLNPCIASLFMYCCIPRRQHPLYIIKRPKWKLNPIYMYTYCSGVGRWKILEGPNLASMIDLAMKLHVASIVQKSSISSWIIIGWSRPPLLKYWGGTGPPGPPCSYFYVIGMYVCRMNVIQWHNYSTHM